MHEPHESFEGNKRTETLPQAEIDFESILEKGEIKSAKELRGYWGMQLVEIKDDGEALFRPDEATDFMFEAKGMEARRSDLELLAYRVDQILEFDLVPVVTKRTIGNFEGSLQRRITNYDASNKGWEDKVKPEEITRAAIFDYLLDVRDRQPGNFIVESDTGKLWLIDHDFFMLLREGFVVTRIVEKAIDKGLMVLGGTEVASLERFLAHADSLTIGAKPEIIKIIKTARDRAEVLLKEV